MLSTKPVVFRGLHREMRGSRGTLPDSPLVLGQAEEEILVGISVPLVAAPAAGAKAAVAADGPVLPGDTCWWLQRWQRGLRHT